jgi:hypothetical protein
MSVDFVAPCLGLRHFFALFCRQKRTEIFSIFPSALLPLLLVLRPNKSSDPLDESGRRLFIEKRIRAIFVISH